MLIETATMTDQFHFLQHFLEQRVTRREKESSKKVSSLTFVAEMLLNKKKKKKEEEDRKRRRGKIFKLFPRYYKLVWKFVSLPVHSPKSFTTRNS